MKNILILYRELAGYTVECLNKLAENHKLLVVHYALNEEAPFDFVFHANITTVRKERCSISIIESFNPHFILCSGWSDKLYLKWLVTIKKPTAVAFDTPWKPSLKFSLGSIYFRWKFKKLFQFAFIPGKAQLKTAKKIGFSEKEIFNGFYTCEDIFQQSHANISEQKELWCVARYISVKNLNFLCENFLSIKPNERSGWKLHIAGTGELFSSRIINDSIIHHGFLQPEELSKKLENATVFVLPSIYEPWGVVVHEMASMGKPLLLSNAVGAKYDLLVEGENGYSFNPRSSDEFKFQLLNILRANEESLKKMGHRSSEISKKFSSNFWVEQFTKMLNASCVE